MSRRPGAAAKAWRCGLAAAAAIAVALPAAALTPTARIEVHAVPTLTLTRAQAYAGRSEGGVAATIAGQLSLPFVAADRMPAVLLLHGDAGIVGNQVAWIDDLNAAGIAVFTLDSFSSRSAVATGAALLTMPDSIGGTARIVDAERSLALLATHPRIDPARIAVMGFSSGANTALLAAKSRFAGFGTPGLRFAAYVALYPDCNTRLIAETRVEPGPQRIFIGEADVLTSAEACVKYAERLRRSGVDIATTTYAGAHHGFDNVANPGMIRVEGVPTSARCTLEEKEPGTIVNVDTGQRLKLEDACIGHGLVAGYDAPANAAARTAIKAFLVERFGLKSP